MIVGTILGVLGKPSSSISAPLYLFTSPGQLDVPFNVELKRSVAKGTLEVPLMDGYTFYLRLQAKDNGPEERARIRKIAGTFSTDKFGHVLPGSSLSVPIRLIITKLGEGFNKTIFDCVFSEELAESSGDSGFYNVITGMTLSRGIYHIEINGVEDNPSLSGIDVYLNVHIRSRK